APTAARTAAPSRKREEKRRARNGHGASGSPVGFARLAGQLPGGWTIKLGSPAAAPMGSNSAVLPCASVTWMVQPYMPAGKSAGIAQGPRKKSAPGGGPSASAGGAPSPSPPSMGGGKNISMGSR